MKKVSPLVSTSRLQIDLDLLVSWTSRSSFNPKSDIPRHTSWSHDGSLLAVAIGSSVVLYDPDTNAIQQSFLTQECRQPSEAHFIGRSRYMAVMGGVDLVVWDIVSQSGAFHFDICSCMLLTKSRSQ